MKKISRYKKLQLFRIREKNFNRLFLGILVIAAVVAMVLGRPVPQAEVRELSLPSLSILSVPDPREEALISFLEGKGSPLPAGTLLEYDNWRMILALSAAESGYGKNLGGAFNAWGIKDFRNGSPRFGKTRDFASWEESIAFVSNLLYKYDPKDGSPSARGMVYAWKYVRPYEHWIRNVEYALWDVRQSVPDNLA